jgi:arginyl-tRNA synthetase
MKETIHAAIATMLAEQGITGLNFVVEAPDEVSHGDYATNVALAAAKQSKQAPRAMAEKLVEGLRGALKDKVEKIEVAGPGFINFHLPTSYFTGAVDGAAKNLTFGQSKTLTGQTIMVEYTDPNPFKIFHIGHLMANAIGESIARLYEAQGATVIRACYQGDVGLHVAKTLWAVQQNIKNWPTEQTPLVEKIKFLGTMYVQGSNAYEDDSAAKTAITALNKIVFERTDAAVNALYDAGRTWSLAYFDDIYIKLGTTSKNPGKRTFDEFFFESQVAADGIAIVQKFLAEGVFEKSDGAIVYKGEQDGLHTRVFINSQGLPTYETKELGLNQKKFALYPQLQQSIVVTANEQNEYFKVLLAAMRKVLPTVAAATRHVSHGLLRPASGKMSSRKGNIVAAEEMIDEVEGMVRAAAEQKQLPAATVSAIAIGAIKYAILRQTLGSDVIFDEKKALSFEGDSGPYVQYACVRARAVLAKGGEGSAERPADMPIAHVERLIATYPDILSRSIEELAPHHLVTYVTQLAAGFHAWYASALIIDPKNPAVTAYKLHITKAVVNVLEQALHILGIQSPEVM